MRLSSQPSKVAISLQTVDVNPLFQEVGWARAVERTDTTLDGDTLTSEGLIPPSLERAAPRRAADFLAGRYCAASAMRAAGFGAGSIGIGTHGAPIWPSGVVGSITHAGRLAIALVAGTNECRSIGIDCEEIIPASVADEIRSTVLSSGELHTLLGRVTPRFDWPTLVTIVFSAKESIYKCLRPLADDFFEFQDVHLVGSDFALGSLAFEVARDLGDGIRRGMKLQTRFSLDERRVYSLATLNRSTRSAV